MSIDGEIYVGDYYNRASHISPPTVDTPTGANFRHSDREIAGGLEYWDRIGPDVLTFHGGRIGTDGTISIGCPDQTCANRTRSYTNQHGEVITVNIPLYQIAHGSIAVQNHKPTGQQQLLGVAQLDSFLKGGFYQPNGNNKPGSMMGEFHVEGSGYTVIGAFASDKK